MSQEVSKRLVSVLQGGTLVVIARDNPYKWPYKWVTGVIRGYNSIYNWKGAHLVIRRPLVVKGERAREGWAVFFSELPQDDALGA